MSARPLPPATLEQYAALKFKNEGTVMRDALGSGREWIQTAAKFWMVVQLAAVTHEKDDDETFAAAVTLGEEAMESFLSELVAVTDYYNGICEMLMTAQVRTMAGMARHALQLGVRA